MLVEMGGSQLVVGMTTSSNSKLKSFVTPPVTWPFELIESVAVGPNNSCPLILELATFTNPPKLATSPLVLVRGGVKPIGYRPLSLSVGIKELKLSVNMPFPPMLILYLAARTAENKGALVVVTRITRARFAGIDGTAT